MLGKMWSIDASHYDVRVLLSKLVLMLVFVEGAVAVGAPAYVLVTTSVAEVTGAEFAPLAA